MSFFCNFREKTFRLILFSAQLYLAICLDIVLLNEKNIKVVILQKNISRKKGCKLRTTEISRRQFRRIFRDVPLIKRRHNENTNWTNIQKLNCEHVALFCYKSDVLQTTDIQLANESIIFIM